MNETKRAMMLAVAVVLIIGSIGYLEATKPARITSDGADVSATTTTANAAEKAAKYSRAKELAGITGYLNTEHFKLADLIGKKVILLDFWTYSCINCQRTIPHLKEWYAKYKDKGFIIVAVHTPEFDFEKDIANVKKAVVDAGIEYPVVLDSDYGTWSAYNNRFWPREFLIDIDGFVVHDHIGEGGYDETEATIQKLLKERAIALSDPVTITDAVTSPSRDDIQASSPETYFGSARNETLGNGVPGLAGTQTLLEPVTVKPNTLYLIGTWDFNPEYAATSATVGTAAVGADRINYRYQAKRVYLVAGSQKKAADIEVMRDGKPIEERVKGKDIFYKNGRSYVKVSGTTLYTVIEDQAEGDHFLEFIVSDPGVQIFTFTFG